MIHTKPILIAALGFSEHEQTVLKSIMGLSEGRRITYRMAVGADHDAADLFMINGDDPDAVRGWLRDKVLQADKTKVTVVERLPANGQGYFVRRPFIAPRLLRILDQAVEESVLMPATASLWSNQNYRHALEQRAWKALVLDDSLVVRERMSLEFQAMGIEADLAKTYAEACELLENNVYDIVFLDVLLPDGDGMQLCKSIKRSAKYAKIPVFLLTGKSSPFDKLKGRMAGCDVYLTKPLDGATLRGAIEPYLRAGFQQAESRKQAVV